jgi:flagellar biosynthesis activator protein FlaF
MRSAAMAYGAVAKQVLGPRELEADLLLKAASRLQAVQDGWETTRPQLNNALLFNRKLWTIFISAITAPEHPMPVSLRQNLANLGLFIFSHTVALQSNPQPHKLTSLIKINREVAAGLRGSA